jgi:hypothetical protein
MFKADTFKFEPVDDFYHYIQEDKSKYKTATECGYKDPDNDFLVGESGGFLFNMNFKFINTHLFSSVANYYTTHGTYIKEKVDSIPYDKFRLREEDRRKHGFVAPCKILPDGTITNLRITGEHYNFLNYVRIKMLDINTIDDNNTAEKIVSFPRFFDSQYWWYKVKEFSKNNGFNLIVAKTRRAGFSYMEGKGGANKINLYPNSTVLLAAWDKKYMTSKGGIADMALDQIDFYETHTPFVRGILSRDIENIRLGWKTPQGIEEGYKSGMVSVSTFNNPDAGVGKDANEVKCEELGAFPNFDEFMRQTDATLKTGAFRTGQAIGFGTVNSKSETADKFEKNFRNPKNWDFMPFENVWDINKRDEICGFYKPFWWGLEGIIDGQSAMDKDGNTDYTIAIKVAEREHHAAFENAKSITDYIDFKGQYGNCPADSFASSDSNLFSSPELDLHYKDVKNNPSYKYYRDGILEEYAVDGKSTPDVKFVSNEFLRVQNRLHEIHPYITALKPDPKKDNQGCIRMYKPPIKIGNVIPDNLYRLEIDPFGVDKTDGNITRDNSFGVILVYLVNNNVTNSKGDILVAAYVGRPLKQEHFSRLALRLSIIYNAKVFTENDRGQIIQDFKHWKQQNRLVLEPNFSWDNSLQGGKGREFGISIGAGATNRRLKGLELLYEYLYTVRETIDGVVKYNFHYIDDEGILNELIHFKNGNFDRVSALIVLIYDIKEMNYTNLKPKVEKPRDYMDELPILERAWY